MYTPPLHAFATMGYHLVFVMLLTIAALIDFDLFIIPDSVTVPGMVFAVVVGTLAPWVRLVPAQASTMLGGLGVGVLGLAVGAGIIVVIRFLGTLAFGREAMGLGDATLLGMIGAFLGWQAVVLDLVLAAFLGLVPALIKIILNLLKRLAGGQLSSADREIPFGPFLSLAAIVLVLTWPWLWPGWARGFFSNLRDAYLLLTGQGLGP
jgi:leader peptidase (prepilin peptidase) / N-methyltransferase